MKCHYLSSNVHRLLATELEICGRLHEKYITPDFNEFVVDLKETKAKLIIKFCFMR